MLISMTGEHKLGLERSVRIRRCQPGTDAKAVRQIFARGIWDTVPPLRREAWKSDTWVGVPAVVGAALWAKPIHIKLPSLLASALLLPTYVHAYMFIVDAIYINRSLKDDLADISGTYDIGNGSAFWVAEYEGEVVGCVGLQQHSKHVAELRRMSVCSSMRGRGIATALCKELISHARMQGIKEVFLLTTSSQYAALAVYKKLGFTLVKVNQPHLIKFVKLKLRLS